MTLAVKVALNPNTTNSLVDVYKFYIQDAPGLITGPVLVLRHLYVCRCRPILKKKFWVTKGLDLY